MYESQMLLSGFAPQMSEHWSLPIYDKGKPEFLLQITFLCYTSCCMPVWDYYIWKYYIEHACIVFSYTGYLYLLLQFCHCDNSTWHLAATSIPHCQIPETTNSYTCVYLQPSFLGLPGFLNLGPKLDKSMFNCGDYWMQAFRVKIYAVAHASFSVHSGIQSFAWETMNFLTMALVVSCPDPT